MHIPTTRFQLADGRTVTYASYGDAGGRPILYFHGFPGSRLLLLSDTSALERLGCRVVVPDRPGYGGSDPDPNGTPGSWAHNLKELTTSLGWTKFALLSFSGGAQYALTFASLFGEHVSRIGICSGAAPFRIPSVYAALPEENRPFYDLARDDPEQLEAVIEPFARNPQALYEQLTGNLGAPDRALLEQSSVSSGLRASVDESMRQGGHGLIRDLCHYVADWSIDWPSIRAPTRLWYGSEDAITSPEMGRQLAALLPESDLRILAGEGHYLIYRHWEEILQRLLE